MSCNVSNFTEARPSEKNHCDNCNNEEKVIKLWETFETDKSEDLSLCPTCFLKSDGFINEKTPAQVLRRFEKIKSIEVKNDEGQGFIVITTESSLGKFEHIFYTEPVMITKSIPVGPHQQVNIGASRGMELTGVSEIYDEEGEFVTSPSPYSDIAEKQALPE